MVLAIGNNIDQAGCQTWIGNHGLTHPVLSNPGSTMYPLFGDGYVPYNAIIDGDGILRYSDSGFSPSSLTQYTDFIEYLLLNIDHDPMPDSEDDVNPYTVTCTINSASPLVHDDLVLHWNLDGGPTFNEVMLAPGGGGRAYSEGYAADIPTQAYGTTVYYYLSVANEGPRAATEPDNAPTGLHSFYVGVDATPPAILHDPLGNELAPEWPPTVSAMVTDNQGINTVTLEFMINDGPVETVPMAPQGDDIYAADLFGSVVVGDRIDYWISAVDVAMTPNPTADPAFGYHSFHIVATKPVFIFEPDPTPLSGAEIAYELSEMGIDYGRGSTALPVDTSLYESIFVFLGVYSNNHQLTGAEGQALKDFLDLGGRVYMEGGDTWAYDAATPVHSYFNINGLNDGSGNAGPISGAAGTFTEGMLFQYGGENAYIDTLAPIGGAEAIFLNTSPAYTNGIAYDGGTYRTIGASIEIGGLVDGVSPSTKHDLLKGIMEYFEITVPVIFSDDFEMGDTMEWSNTVQ